MLCGYNFRCCGELQFQVLCEFLTPSAASSYSFKWLGGLQLQVLRAVISPGVVEIITPCGEEDGGYSSRCCWELLLQVI